MEGEEDALGTRAHSLAKIALFVLASAVLVVACGRSNLDDYVLHDGGPTVDGGLDGAEGGGRCNPQTCPTGCCDENDQCQGGDSLAACGSGGGACSNCPALGFQFCDANLHSCANKPGSCDSTTCAIGCCEQGLCLVGSDPNECGSGGGACQHCAQQGLTCNGKSCQKPACGPGNCSGCCFGDQCVSGQSDTSCGQGGQQCANCISQNGVCAVVGPVGGVCRPVPPGCNSATCAGGCCDQFGNCNRGITDTQCGVNGQFCQNCTQLNESCQFQQCQPVVTQCNGQTCPGGCCQGNVCMSGGDNAACGTGGLVCVNCTQNGLVCNGIGRCIPTPPLCNPATCPNGCCIGNVCAVGTQNNACGKGGAQCQSCTALNETCTGQTCVPVVTNCTPQNCAGCCDGTGTCQPGFLNNQCGQNGTACVNCQSQGSTCDTAVMPRVCKNMQTTCPATYPSCPSSVTTPIPPIAHVCAASDLTNARSACSAGAHTTGCQQFIAFEQAQKPQCAACLTQFDYDFQELTGLLRCAAPFVSPSCDHATGCISDCVTKSCALCDSASIAQCQTDVRTGQCQQYFNQAQCIIGAFMGAGSFCSPQNYGGNYGAWLQGVGGHYCGP